MLTTNEQQANVAEIQKQVGSGPASFSVELQRQGERGRENRTEEVIVKTVHLIVAITIQIVNNYFVSRVDSLIVDMEESSVDFVDTLIEMEKAKA